MNGGWVANGRPSTCDTSRPKTSVHQSTLLAGATCCAMFCGGGDGWEGRHGVRVLAQSGQDENDGNN